MSQTIKQILQSNKTIDQLDAELLIAHTLGKSREFVLSHLDYRVGKLTSWQVLKLASKSKYVCHYQIL